MDEVEKLFEVLKRDGYYTKSFEEFKEQYADESYREKIYEVMSRDKYYTKSRDEFFQQYSVGDNDVEVVKTPTYQSTTLKTKDDEVVEEEEQEVVFEPTEEGKFKVGIQETEQIGIQETEQKKPISTKEHFSPLEEEDLADNITFEEFDNVPEEDLQKTLENQYPWLEFDQPFIYDSKLGGGANRDVIQVTNPQTGATKDFDLGTDFNRQRSFTTNPLSSKESYDNMLSFINEQRYDKEGNPNKNYLDHYSSTRTYGPDYLIDDLTAPGGKTELPVSKEVTSEALRLVKSDPTGKLTMKKAIQQVANSQWGQMNIAWKTDFYNDKNFENVTLVNATKDAVENGDLNINITTTDQINDPNLVHETYQTLRKLGVPAEVFKTDIDQDYLEALYNIDSVNPDPADELVFEKYQRTRDAQIKDQVYEYLNTTQKGRLILQTYNAVEEQKNVDDIVIPIQNKVNEEVTAEDPRVAKTKNIIKYYNPDINEETAEATALEMVRNQETNDRIDAKVNEYGEKEFEWQVRMGYGMNAEDLKALKEKGKKAKTPEELEAYRAEVRDLVNDGKINLLRNPDGTFVDQTLQQQTDALKDNKKLGSLLDEYMYQSSDELTQELFNMNNQLKVYAKDILREGYGNTMVDATLAQQLGEGLSFLTGWATVGSTKGLPGSAYRDFENIDDWINGSEEMPIGLTTLPESASASKTVKNYNDLLEKRATLLLAKELNVNPMTFGKHDWGVVRAAHSFGQELIPALGGRYMGEEEMRSNALDIYENAFGITRTESQDFIANHLGGYEKAGSATANLVVMAGEMALTYPLFGGARSLTKGIYLMAEAGLTSISKKAALSPGFIKSLSKYTSHVGTEYVGLVGSNIMERNIFNREGIHNPLLFAAGAGGARAVFAKGGEMYNQAVKEAAKVNPRLRESLLWVSQQEMTANVEGALKLKAIAQSGTRNIIVKPTLIGGEALTGAIGIKAGEGAAGVVDVVEGKKTMSQLWNEITDVDSLLETAAALVFMKVSRPDQYVNKAVEDFYAEVDLIAGNNPAWNRMRDAIGLKRLSPKEAAKASEDPNYELTITDAYNKKLQEIQKGEGDYEGLSKEELDQATDNLNYQYNRLLMKPELDRLAKMYKAEDGIIGSYTDLELASLNIAEGSMNAKDLLTIASTPSGGSSAVLQLMANGYTEKIATQIYDFAVNQKAIGMELFAGDLRSKPFQNYVKESIRLNELISEKRTLEDTYKNNKIDKAAYEIKNENLDKAIDAAVATQKINIKKAQFDRQVKESKTIQELKDKGFNVIEVDNKGMKEFKEKGGEDFVETEFGLQGIDKATGQGVMVVNTEATKKYGVGGTATHEVWHFGWERKLGDQALAKRAEEVGEEQANAEAREYIQNFTDGLKKRGIYDVVEAEMLQRKGFQEATWRKVLEGEQVPMSEMKEFINEFIQLDKNGSFDAAKTDAQVKASKRQEGKNITEAEYKAAMADPAKFVDFVLSGKYKSKNINDFLKAEQDAYTKEFGGKKETTTQKSEKTDKVVISKSNKEIADRNTEIEKKIIKAGDSRVRDIKDQELSAEIKKELSENNIGKARQLANQAAKSPGAMALEPSKRVSAEEFRSGYEEQLARLIDTYKPIVNGKRIPFGAYMQKNLKRRYGQILQQAKRGKFEGKEKRLGQERAEGEKEFDVVDPDAQRAVESVGESKSLEPTKTDRQISVFEGRQAKAKEKQIVDIFKGLTEVDLVNRSKKGLGGTPTEELTKVAELLFDLKDGGKVTNLSKSSYPSVDLVNPKTGKKLTPAQIKKGVKGIIDAKDFVNIRDYFKDVNNLDRYLKTMPEYNITGDRSRINDKGETIEVSPDVKGKGLRLTDRVYDYFYEPFINHPSKPGYNPKLIQTTPGGRSKGKTTQPFVKRLKPEFRGKISPEVIKKLREDLLLDTKVEDLIKIYDRTKHGQLIKGMAKLETMKVANEATRKGLPKDTELSKKLTADTRAGGSDFAASERVNKKAIEEIRKKIISRSFVSEMQGMANWIKSFAKDMDIAIAKEIGSDGNVRDLIGQQRLSDFASKVLSKYFGESILSGQTWSNTKLGKGMWFSTDLRNKVLEEFRKEQKDLGIPLTTKEYNALKLLMGSPGLDPMKTNPFGGKQSGKWIEKVNRNYEGLDLFIDQTFKMLKENPEYLGEFLAMMKGSSSSNSHFWRNASQVIGKHKNWADKAMINPKKKGVGVGEHALVQNQAAEFMTKAILESIARGNLKAKNIAKKLLNENYFQILISHGLDGKLTQIGLQSSMPKGFWESWNKALETGDVNKAWSVWSRYFNEKINKIKGADGEFGFDPNKIDLLNRKTGEVESLADILKIGRKEFGKDILNPEIIAKQQELIAKWSTRQEGFTKPEQLRERLAIELDMLNAKRDATLETMKDISELNNPIFNMSERMPNKSLVEEANKFDKALANARKIKKEVKKARVFDFDDTVARTNSKVFAERAGERIELTAEEFAARGDVLLAEGYKMDFSDFNKVVEGKKGPLFDVMKKMKEAAGDRDMFILTARAPESAPAIKQFLDAMGIKIPLENITGLGNSTGKAKADWLVEKAAEGYNDFYFADDAPQNVKAVRDAMEVLDVKSKVQQARMNASERLNKRFNEILEHSTGIGKDKVFSDVKAEIRGNEARRQKFFIPPSAEDFTGLLYRTLGKGKKGEQAMNFYKENLLDPYTRAMENLSTDRVNLMADFKELKKELKVPKELKKTTKSGFKREDAVRVYIWQKTGKEIPGLAKKDLAELNKIMESDPRLQAFADQILTLTKGDGYSTPGKDWNAGTITTDLIELLNKTKRAKYLTEWKENVDVIFSKKNLNKLEAAYGKKYREALENSLTRMKQGTNRTSSGNKLSNQVLDYVNNATGTIMFLNARSAVLQTISAANFTNWTFNNPLKMGKAFANQPQYWKDFVELINSDYLKDRRNGLKLNISESEIANAAKTSKNKARAVMGYILEKGYLPTKFADSFAIASGGAMFYRNRINDLIKNHGKTEAEAKKIAMEEFRKVSETSQQSSDPSKISQQQASDLGRIVLSFANTPMQYARIQKRAIQDIANGRGSNKENISKIIYYGFLQNIMFNALQQGLFALGFGDGEIRDKEEEKIINSLNGMVDSQLRGLGMAGVTIQVIKNLGIDIYRRSQRVRPDFSDAWQKLLEFSPAIKSKLSKFKGAAYPFDSKKRRQEVFDKGFSLDNPAYESLAKVVSGVTNFPLDRLYSKVNNLQAAANENTETWKAVALTLGWPEWQLESGREKEEKKSIDLYNKAEQVNILKQYGLTETEIKKLKNEDQRVKKIEALRKKTNKIYIPKNVKKEENKTKEKKAKEKKKSSPFSTRLKNKKLTTTFN